MTHSITHATARRLPALLLVAALGATVLAGCGSSGSGKSSESGDRAAFCVDNDTLNNAASSAKSLADVVSIFKKNVATIDDFEAQAPKEEQSDAKLLAAAAHKVISTGDASSFATSEVGDAGKRVDAFCQPTTSTTT